MIGTQTRNIHVHSHLLKLKGQNDPTWVNDEDLDRADLLQGIEQNRMKQNRFVDVKSQESKQIIEPRSAFLWNDFKWVRFFAANIENK